MSFAIVAGAVIAGGAAVYAGRQTGKAGERAASGSNAESARQFDLVRGDTAGQRQLGQGATSLLGRLYGLPVQTAAQRTDSEPVLVGDTYLPAGTTTKHVGDGWYQVLHDGKWIGTLRPGGPNGRFINETGFDVQGELAKSRQQADQAAVPTGRPDMSAFIESPDFQFNLGQGQQAIDRSIAARGRALSGAGVKEGQRFASGLASSEFNNFTQRLLQMAGLGGAATGQSASAGFQHAGNVAANNAMGANARASGFQTAAAGVNNAVQGGISNMMLQRYLSQGAG